MTPPQMSPSYQLIGENGSPIPSISCDTKKLKNKKQNKLQNKRHEKDLEYFTDCPVNSENKLVTQQEK